MKNLTSLLACGSLLACLAGCDAKQPPRVSATPTTGTVETKAKATIAAESGRVRAVTFNVRVSLKQDGDNSWQQRREIAIDTIKRLDADFVGLQEAFVDQRLTLVRNLDEFVEIDGTPERRDFANLNPILVREQRFAIVRQGTFWLSETPEKPLSSSWGSKIPRACTWVVAQERGTERELVVLNTHLQSGEAIARQESAKLIVKRLEPFARLPSIVLGDLNSRIDSDPMKTLLAAGLLDCFGAVHPDAKDVRTYHAFDGDPSGPHRIDFVLSSTHWRLLDAGIDHSQRDGRFPSDHFPVWANLGW